MIDKFLIELFYGRKNKEIERQFYEDKVNSYEKQEKDAEERMKRIPKMNANLSEEFFTQIFSAYFESVFAYRHRLFRSAMFNIVCIIEHLHRKKFNKYMAGKNLEDSFKSGFITERQFNFLKVATDVRNKGIHDISDVTEQEVLLAFQIMNELLQNEFGPNV